MTKLVDIEGVGKTYAAKMEKIGVKTVEELLRQGASKKGRTALAEKSGVSDKLILEWVNRADLTRIRGVSTQYADLLESAGVDSVPELAQRNVENLQQKMAEVNAKKKLVRLVPGINSVSSWVEQAKKLPKLVTH
ncbi:MAG: DUF4332 domain-containing protein [Pseudomonadales bacterium]|nr:DUF4332 domain-containing protein [Pseudomonadales bacterium]